MSCTRQCYRDTAGQERFAPLGMYYPVVHRMIILSCIGGLYYHGAHAVIMAYDVTSKNTFDNIDTWNDKFDERDVEGVDSVKVLVGCKSDLEDARQASRDKFNILYSALLCFQISQDSGKTKAIKIGARWAETSSKNGDNVESLFTELARSVLERKKVAFRREVSFR